MTESERLDREHAERRPERRLVAIGKLMTFATLVLLIVIGFGVYSVRDDTSQANRVLAIQGCSRIYSAARDQAMTEYTITNGDLAQQRTRVNEALARGGIGAIPAGELNELERLDAAVDTTEAQLRDAQQVQTDEADLAKEDPSEFLKQCKLRP